MFSKAMCTRAYYFWLFVPIFPDISTVKICNTSNKNEHCCQKVRGKENHKIWDGISDLLLIGMSPCGRLLFCSWSSVLARSRSSDDSRFKSQVIQINPTNRNHQNLCRHKVASSWWCVKGEYKFSCMVIFLTTFFRHLMIKWSTSCLHLLFYALHNASQHCFQAHRMLPYQYMIVHTSIASVINLYPIIIHAQTLD